MSNYSLLVPFFGTFTENILRFIPDTTEELFL